MQLSIDDKWLHEQIIKSVGDLKLVPITSLKGRTISMEQFRRLYCGGKGRDWVQFFIFDAFPETNFENGGFVKHPHPKQEGAKRTIIFAYQASLWMEKHRNEIDWDGRIAK